MQVADETLALLFDDGRHVLEQHLTGAVDLGQTFYRFPQVFLRMPQTRDKAGRETGFLKDPRVLSRKPSRPCGVIGGHETEALFTRAPGDADRV